MYMYKISGDTSNQSIITDDPTEIAELTAQGWYPSETPIIWSGTGAKRMPIFGVLEDVPVEPVQELPQLTPKEIKQQKLQQLDWEYQPQFLELSRAWADATMEGKTELANSISADRLALKQEYEQKRGEING